MSEIPTLCASCGEELPSEVESCPNCSTERIPSTTLATIAAEDLLRAPSTATTPTAHFGPLPIEPRFVGRQAEHDQIMRLFGEMRRRGNLAFLAMVGPPGSGKTRLAGEVSLTIAQRAPDARFLVAPSGSSPALPFAGFVRLLQTRLGLTGRESNEEAQRKILSGVAEVLPGAKVVEVGHLLAHLIGVGFQKSPIVDPLAEAPKQLETRTFIAVKRFLEADARQRPLVLCFDDLDQAGPETVNLLHYLAAGLSSAPVLLLALARPSIYRVHPGFGGGEREMTGQRLDLGPLTPDDSESLMRELLRTVDGLPPALLEHARELGGLPRTLFELARLLVEAEVIARSGSRWRVDEQRLAAMILPRRPEELSARRLAQMPADERSLLEKAACCGEVFWLDAVVALVRAASLKGNADGPTLAEIAADESSRSETADALAKLASRDWIAEDSESHIAGEQQYRFAYPQLWDAVASGIAPEAAARDHRLVAQWLELRPEGREEEAQEEIGHHLERAGDSEAASSCYRRAGDAARARYMNEKAIRLYAQALACLSDGNLAARIHLWHDLGSVYELKGDFEAALGAFEHMLRLTWVVASRNKAAVAFNKLGRVWRRKGDLKLALEYLQRGQELFEQACDGRGVASSLDDIGQALYLQGRYDEAFERITLALKLRGKEGDKRSIAHSLSNLGNVQKDRGKLAEAERCHQEAHELRQQVGDRAGAALSRSNLAVLAYERGDRDAARRGWEQALEEAEKIGALPLLALVLSNLGELARLDGKSEEARRRLEETMNLARDLDDRRLLSEAARNLGLLELEGGNSKRARELTTRALDIAESSGLRDYVGRALLALGEVHAATLFDEDRAGDDGKGGDAETFFKRGVELFRDLGNESELAKGLERFGRFKLERGEISTGRGLLEEAQAIFARLGMKAGEDVGKVIREL